MISNWTLALLFIVLLCVPTIVNAVIGWRAGRRFAHGTLTTRASVLFAGMLLAMVIAYAALDFVVQRTSQDGVVEFDALIGMFLRALAMVISTAFVAGAVAWAMNRKPPNTRRGTAMRDRDDIDTGDGDAR